MFTCYRADDFYENPVKVYWVDFAHDAFLVNVGGKFRWVPMDEFIPFGD